MTKSIDKVKCLWYNYGMGKKKTIIDGAKTAAGIFTIATAANAFDGFETVNPYIAGNYTQVNYDKVGDYSINATAGANKTFDINEDHSIVLDASTTLQNVGKESGVSLNGGAGWVLKTDAGNERAVLSVGASTAISKKKDKIPTTISIDGRISFGK